MDDASAKRLEQIKKNWKSTEDVRGHIEGSDVDWLIQQIEDKHSQIIDLEFQLESAVAFELNYRAKPKKLSSYNYTIY